MKMTEKSKSKIESNVTHFLVRKSLFKMVEMASVMNIFEAIVYYQGIRKAISKRYVILPIYVYVIKV